MGRWTQRFRLGQGPTGAVPSVSDDGSLFDLDDVGLETGDGNLILRGVDLTIPARGITVVVGPSGAGKSTLARLLNRLEVPTSGSVGFRGADVGSVDPLALRRAVGLVFQRPALFGGTVRDNLAVALDDEDPDRGDDRLGRALASVSLEVDLLDQVADTLSGGEAQRVCLARTMLADPQVLVADEATASVDPVTRTALERRALELARSGMPIVWITHDLDQISTLADLVVVMIDGTVRWAGPPGELSGHPDAEVQSFLTGGEP